MSGILLLLGLLASSPASDGPSLPPAPDLSLAEAPVRALVERRRAAVLAEPTSAEAWGRLGMAFDIHDLEPEAVSCYRRATQLDAGELRWAYYLAMVLADQADLAAVEAFESARALRPGHGPLLVRYGDLLLELGRFEQARQVYDQAIARDGDGVAHALAGLARLALAEGDLDRAQAHARDALASDARHGPARGLLAEIHRRRGELEAAERIRSEGSAAPANLVDELVAELMEDGVSSYWHHQRSRILLSGRQPERAEQEARAALALSPRALFHQDLARALLVQERDREAEAELRKALDLAPDLATSHHLLGRLLEQSGRPEEAITALTRAAELRPDSGAARELGQLLSRSGRHGEGIHWLRRSLVYDPEPRVLLAVAWALATSADEGLRDAEAAESYARQLIELTGDERFEPLDALAAALAAQGRFAEAVATAERAVAAARGKGSVAWRLENRLALYRAGRPFVAKR